MRLMAVLILIALTATPLQTLAQADAQQISEVQYLGRADAWRLLLFTAGDDLAALLADEDQDREDNTFYDQFFAITGVYSAVATSIAMTYPPPRFEDQRDDMSLGAQQLAAESDQCEELVLDDVARQDRECLEGIAAGEETFIGGYEGMSVTFTFEPTVEASPPSIPPTGTFQAPAVSTGTPEPTRISRAEYTQTAIASRPTNTPQPTATSLPETPVAIPTGGPIGDGSYLISGTLVLFDSDATWSPSLSCTGEGGFSDIGPGASIEVRNGANELVGVDRLGPGRPVDFSSYGRSTSNVCEFRFIVVVSEEQFYTIAAGRRGGLSFSFEDLTATSWVVALSLGNL